MNIESIFLVISLIFMIIMYSKINNLEKFNKIENFKNGDIVEHNTNTLTQDLNNKIKRMIDEQYNYDVDAIRNLGAISKSLLTGKNYHNTTGVTAGDLTIPANIKTLGNQNVNGNINIDGNHNVKGTLSVGGFELLPEGSVIIWTKSAIPSGWVICDGDNNTPDLRGRFVLGSGQGNGLTNRTLESNGGLEKVLLKDNEVPLRKHYHEINGGQGGYKITDYDGGRYDLYESRNMRSGPDTPLIKKNGDPFDYDNFEVKSHNNMPPFYVLIYIMKVY